MKYPSTYEQKDSQNNSQKNKNLPFYMRLYPPLESPSENQTDFHSLHLKLDSSNQNLKNILGKQETEEQDELTQDFLDELVKPLSTLPKTRIMEVVSKVIMKSKLIEKIEDDNKLSKKINSLELSMACAKKFTYVLVKRGENVFRIGDIGDKFYYILKGKVNILKIKEIPNIYMSIIEYLNYCIFLLKQEENYLLQEVILRNYNILQITTPEEIYSLYKIAFKKSLQDNINQHLIFTNKQLDEYFKAFDQKYKDYDLDKRHLDVLEYNKNKKIPGSYIEWQNYIVKKCELTTNELVTYEPYEQLIKDKKKKKIVCFIYESLLSLGPGLYFGDFALDSEVNKRNATIRVEEDAYLGWLRSTDYLNMIAPRRRYEKMKEIAFLFNSFFFHNINPHTFERVYFHLFYLKEYPRGTILFYPGKMPKNIYLIKDGHISLDLKCSVLEIHKLIKYLYNKIITNPIYSKLPKSKKNLILPQEIINRIYKYFKEPKLERLKMQNNEFINEMNKKRIFHITLLIGIEPVGIEEIFMKIPYLMKGTAIKKLICYEFAVEQIENLLKDEKEIRFNFAMSGIKKILSLIERLQSIKKNCVEMANSKYNIKSESIFEKAFASTQYFPLIPNKNNKKNKSNSTDNKINENKSIIKDEINYNDNIYNILNRTNSNSKSKEKKEAKFQKEKSNSFDLEKNDENIKNEEQDENNINYKKIKILNTKDKSRNIFTTYKSPIRDFFINKNTNYRTILLPSRKNNKNRNMKFISNNSKRRNQNNSYYTKEFSNPTKNLEISNDKEEETPKKSKLNTGLNVKNLFLLGDKYYTIGKLKKQIKDFNSLENNKKKVEIIQSNQINNNEASQALPTDIKNSEIKKINIFNIKKLKSNFIKFSQEFKNFHLSFVPISADKNGANSTINAENNNIYKILKNNSYSSFGDKFFGNKTMKNYFLINKKNRQYKKKYFNRVNSDLEQYHKDLPKIQNDYFNFQYKDKNKNHFSSQVYSNKNYLKNNNKRKYEFISNKNL